MKMQQFQLFKDDTRYAYAVGVIRVLETRLLNSADLQRMLEADSPQTVLAALSDTEYEISLSKVKSEWDFETALREEMERIYRLTDKLTQDKELTDIFRIKWDFHNLKVLLKSKYLQSLVDTETRSADVSSPPQPPRQQGVNILVPSGLEDLTELEAAVMSEKSDSRMLPEYLQVAITEVESEAEMGIDPQLIDIILDKHAQSLNYRRAAEYSEFLQEYFQIAIDLNNIRNFLRVKILNKDRDFLSKVLLDDGTLKTTLFLNQFDESIENFARAVKYTHYYELIKEGLEDWTENHSLATLEKFSDNYLLNYIKRAKFAILGVEPLLGYLLAKEHEMKLIRIIMIGKLNGLPSESIRERLRETYV
ncbi:V-type ATP synthase subunit C [Candidatus Poribacteria bacterium]|nr:V-type ATP synthase subunit C [Candidatus Poribacteria bacterium]